MTQRRYFLTRLVNGQGVEQEVSLREYCDAERSAGFRPKLPSCDPAYMTTPATSGFGAGGISGRIQYASVTPVDDEVEIVDVKTPTPTMDGALATISHQFDDEQVIDPDWQRVRSTQTLEPGYYWRALEDLASNHGRQGDVLLLVEVIEFEDRVHSVKMRCHPRFGEGEFVLLVEDFVRAFEPCPDGEEVRQREQQEVMQRVADLQGEIVTTQSNPQLMIEAVRATVEKAVAEEAGRQAGLDKRSSEARAKSQASLDKVHRRAARRSAANGNPLAAPKATLSSDVSSIIGCGVDAAGVEQMAVAAKTHAIVAEAQVKWLESKTREISSTIRAMTPYINERAAVALARSAGALQSAKRLREGIASLDLYTGKNVDVFDIRVGESADANEKLVLMQSKRYMDEELAVWADVHQGFDFRDKKTFFDALASNDALLEQVLPTPRCVVSMAVTRRDIKYEISAENLIFNMQNQMVFLLVRNGDNVHVVYSGEPSHEAAERLFPTANDLDAPFRGVDGSTISIRSVDFGRSAKRFDDLALVYKRFLILLCGLDHRLKLLGQFYPEQEQLNFMSLDFQERHFRFVCDDEAGQMLGDALPHFSDWMRRHNDMVQSGSRVFALASGVSANAPEIVRRKGLKPTREQFQRPFIAFKDGANLAIKVHAVETTSSSHAGKVEINAKCVLDGANNDWRANLWWLCVDGVSLADVQRYRHSRLHRSMGISYLLLLRRVESFLIEEQAAQADARAYLLEAATTQGGLPAQQVSDLLDTAIRTWRAARRGAALPGVHDKADLNEVLSLMTPNGALPGAVDQMLEAYLEESRATPLLLTRSGKDKLLLYVLATDEDRKDYPNVLRWGWVKRITLSAGKTKLRETGSTLVWLGTHVPASEAEIRRWPELSNWMHPVDEPITLRRYAKLKENLLAAEEWAPVLYAGPGAGIPESLFLRVYASCLDVHASSKAKQVADALLAIPLALYVNDGEIDHCGPISSKQKLRLAYACMRAEAFLCTYGDDAQRQTVRDRYMARSKNQKALAGRLADCQWRLKSVGDDLAIAHDRAIATPDHADIGWAGRKVKAYEQRITSNGSVPYLADKEIKLSFSRAFAQLMGVSRSHLRKAFYANIEDQVKRERHWPWHEKDERKSKIAALKSNHWHLPWRAQPNALAWDSERGHSPANAFFGPHTLSNKLASKGQSQ